MKKRRIISALLAALMVTSSLPIIASAEEAPVDVKLGAELIQNGDAELGNANWAENGSTLGTKGEENKYVHVYNRTSNTAQFIFAPGKVIGAGDYKMTMRVRSQSIAIDPSLRICAIAWGAGQKTAGSWTYTPNTKTNDWINITNEFSINADKNFSVIIAGSGCYGVAPFDLDDVVLYQKSGSGWNEIGSWDFEAAIPGANGSTVGCSGPVSYEVYGETKYFTVRNQVANNKGVNYTTDIALEPGKYVFSGDFRLAEYDPTSIRKVTIGGKESYLGVEHDNTTCDICKDGADGDYVHHFPQDTTNEIATGTTWVNSSTRKGVILGTGTYNMLYKRTADTSTTVEVDSNYRGLRVAFDGVTSGWQPWSYAEYGNNDSQVNFLKIDDDWTHGEIALEVNDYCTLNTIRMEGDSTGYSVLPMDFDNISLKQVESYVKEDVTVSGNVTTIPVSALVDGAGNPVDTAVMSSFEDGNKYLRLHGRNNNWAGLGIKYAPLTLDAANDYYLSFRLRTPVEDHKAPGSSLVTFQSQVTNSRLENLKYYTDGVTANRSGVGMYIKEIDTDWVNVVIPYTQDSYTVAQLAQINVVGMYNGDESMPIDFDNFEIYHFNGDTKVIDWSEDFSSAELGDYGTAYGEHFSMRLNSGCTGMFSIEEDVEYASVDSVEIAYAPDNYAVAAGMYVLKAQMAYPVFDPTEFTKGGGNGQIILENGNCYDLTTKVTLDDGTVVTADPVTVGNQWTDIELGFTAMNDTTLDAITLSSDGKEDLRIRNVTIEYTPFDELTTEDEENFLDGTTLKVLGATIENVEIDKPDGFVRFPERIKNPDNDNPGTFIGINCGFKPKAGVTYFFEYDIRSEGFTLRPRVNFPTVESEKMNGYYVVQTSATNIKDIGGPTSYTIYSYDTGDWQHFQGAATPTADSGSLVFTITRTTGFDGTEFDFDNFKVFYMDGSEQVVIYENDFNDEDSMTGITTYADAPYNFILDPSHSIITPTSSTEPVSVVYDLDIPEEDAVKGDYIFKADIRTADKLAEDAVITVTYTFEDGTTKSTEWNVNSDWNTFTFFRAVDEAALESVTLSYTGASALLISDAKLMINVAKNGGIPNIGIIMMLLHKRSSGTGVDTVTETVELIPDGKFDGAFDFTKVVNAYPNIPANTWMNHSNYASKMETVNVDGNNVLSVSGIQTNWNGIAYGLGELQPGEYTFSVDLKLANAADQCSMRASVNNADNIDGYLASDNGQLVSVNGKQWTHIEYKFTIAAPTAASIRIRGGMGGAPDTVPYYVDNLSLTTTVTKEVIKETEPVEGNLIVNGDFDEAPIIAAGDKYDETKANTWFQNDGDGYEKDNKGQDIKDKPIHINHKIEWTDGYLTFSGRTNNLRNFWYNGGVTLEPGNYTLTLDFKTAQKGESTSVRVGVHGLFNPTVNDALAIDNEWKTMTINFEVKEASPLRLNIYGGPGASFKHDFCIDNVVLVKN